MVKCSPLLYQARCGPGKVTFDRAAIVDTDQCFVLGVDRMEVRRIVISEVHVDRYPVELAQPRHPNNLRRPKALLWSHLTRGEEGRSRITTQPRPAADLAEVLGAQEDPDPPMITFCTRRMRVLSEMPFSSAD